jgi:hypothetical protein
VATDRLNTYDPETQIAIVFYQGRRHEINVRVSAQYPARPNKPEQIAMCMALLYYMEQQSTDAIRYSKLKNHKDGTSIAMTHDGNTGATPYINGEDLDKCVDSL